jgi:serine/threonine-protein kinase
MQSTLVPSVPAASSTENDSSFAYAPGDLIASKYRLEELLGEGGMGAVFRARNTSLDMLVAIKLLRADLSRELLAGRLLQEARAAAKLTHAAIVRVFDVGQTALGDPFIVMELLEGETLSKVMDREGPMTAIHAVQLLLPIADGLSAAHAKGLVHRDVKPDNVLLVVSDEGIAQPKLLDFGIVKSAQPDGSLGPSDAGTVVGSPDYMSPEQARGLERVDSRSDLWSFSVVLYEAIAGTVPFHSNDYNALLRMIVQTEPKALKDLGVADHALSYIVARGLSKDPLDRYPSLSQMGKALAAWLADQGVTEDASGVSLEAKWLGRATDPSGRRASWPPPARVEQVSGIRKIEVTFGDAPIVHAPLYTIPPSSLAPVVDSGTSDREDDGDRHSDSDSDGVVRSGRAPRRSLLAVAAAALLAMPLGWLVFTSQRTEPQSQAAVAAVGQAAPVAAEVAPPPPPVTIASTVSPAAPPEAELAPANSATTPLQGAAADRPSPPPSRQATPGDTRRNVASKSLPAAKPQKKPARPSSLLAPMPF